MSSSTYPCTLCDEVFTKAYELKKHKATHENPDSVFHCPHCPFISLQKKNLAVHIKSHTGEKDLVCPHMITPEQLCFYRTNDPAALSKHRQKMHGYIPPPNRSRPKKASSALSEQRRTEKPPCRRRSGRAQPIAITPRRKHILSRKASMIEDSSGKLATPWHAPFVPLENVDGHAMDRNYDNGTTTLLATDDKPGLDTLYDASLHSQWMAQYEMSYSAFDMAGTNQPLDVLTNGCPFDPANNDEPENRGCLCPEWMRELRLEGWSSPVETLAGY